MSAPPTVRPALPGHSAPDPGAVPDETDHEADHEADYAAARYTLMSFIVSQTLVAVVQAGVVDALSAGPRDLRGLATETAVDADALRRMLTVLAAEELVSVTGEDVALLPRGRFFCSATPGSLGHLCALMSEEAFTCWAAAGHALRTGTAGFDAAFGQPYFSWLAGSPEAAARFHTAQAGLVTRRLQPLHDLDWSGVGTVVDVGAGTGSLLAELLTAQPHLTGVGLDVPAAVARATATLAAAGLGDRAQVVAGDFFAEVPAGADVYVLAQVLHDWDDGDAVRILRRCRSALGPGGRLLVLEQVVPEGTDRHPARLLDLHMLVLLGGRERTAAQWATLLERAGLELEELRPGARSSLLVARAG